MKPGGLLHIDNATLTGIDYLGSSSLEIRYNAGWKGILVEGTGTANGAHGRVVVLNNSVIDQAVIGIESVNGGRVIARNSDFTNNRVSIYIHDYNHPNLFNFFIQGCDFDVTEPLRDVTWTPWNKPNLPGLLQPRHFRKSVPQIPNQFIKLENIAYAQIIGGTCKRTFTDADISDDDPDATSKRQTTGIEAINARFSCSNVTFFSSLDLGISVLGTTSGVSSGPHIKSCTFNSRGGILLNGADYVTIGSFGAPNNFSNSSFGISANASSSYNISNNNFNGSPIGILSSDSDGNYANVIERNIFTGSHQRQIQFQVSNPEVQFRCNTFNTPELHSVALASGSLPAQGDCELKPAGNLFGACAGLQSQLFRNQGAGVFEYNSHNDVDRLPVCYSPDITVNDCGSYTEKPSCDLEPPCNPCPRFPEKDKITGIEAQKQALAGSGLPPAEIAATTWQLTWEQKIIAQQGLGNAIEADTTLSTAFDYLDEVGVVFPFPASDRISLNLSSGNLPSANNLIAALPAGNEKTLFSLQSTLYAEGRSFKQITPAEEQVVRAISQGNDQSAAQAKSILYAAFGEAIVIEPEPLSGSGRPAPERTNQGLSTAVEASLMFAPNPGSDITSIRYTFGHTGREATFILSDMYGRQVLTHRIPADNRAGEFELNLHDLPLGTYIGTTILDGQHRAVSKLAIVR